ncbi:MAG TPA: hypothetical protein VFG21_11405 [Xanthomonadaceae bacterium]|nr:hypothetical protein [Xanthomonadaceae bacterium]
MDSYPFALGLHLLAGTSALLSFWFNAALRKGTPLHRRVGQVYLLSMLGVIVSGVPLAHALIGRGHPLSAMFLGYLIVLVSQACWNAWRAIRERARPERYFGAAYWSLTAIACVAGIGMIVLGVQVGATLFIVFGSIGVVSVPIAWASWRARANPRWWIREHYGAIVGCGVATHIAFLGIGLRRLLPGFDPGALQALAWFGPLGAAVLAAWWLNRRYGRAGLYRPKPAPVGGAPASATMRGTA